MSPQREAFVTLAMLIGTFLVVLDSTVVGMATAIGDLGGPPLYPWVFASCLPTVTVAVPAFEKLPDTYGRKPIRLLALGLVSLPVVAFFPGGSASSLFNREEDPFV